MILANPTRELLLAIARDGTGSDESLTESLLMLGLVRAQPSGTVEITAAGHLLLHHLVRVDNPDKGNVEVRFVRDGRALEMSLARDCWVGVLS